MKYTTYTLVACALVLSLSATAGSDEGSRATSVQPYSELLEQAIFTEETVGDLDAAIEIYEQIIEQAETNRPYVAQARFRLGMCYLKKGNKEEAAEALRRIVADFPKQLEVVAQARARLTELGVPVVSSGVVLRQVWENAEDFLGSPSPDGRYLSFTDWTTGDLAIHDFDTGKKRSLTGKGSWATPHYAEFSIFSPDGKQIAYAWYGGETIYDLRVIASDGSGDRVVYAQKDTSWVAPLDWTPDGKQILAWLSKPNSPDRLALITVEDGSKRVLTTLDSTETEPGRIDLSPDGKHVVYSHSQGPKTNNRDIYLLSTRTGRSLRLVEHPGNDLALGWSPDGRLVLFASDRSGDWSVWALTVVDGEPEGTPKLVKSSLGDLLGQIRPMGLTRSGSFYYGISGSTDDVYQASIDPSTGKVVDSPTMVTRSFEGSNSRPDWSRDGKRLAWISKREGSYILIVRDLETGTEKQVPVSTRVLRLMNEGLRWSPDGGSLLIGGVARPMDESWWSLLAIDAETGEVMRIAKADKGMLRQVDWSPDGKTVYFERDSLSGSAIVAFDLASGQERVVHPGHVGRMALSPDGRWIAFTTDLFAAKEGSDAPRLSVVSTAGGEPREVFRSTKSAPFESRSPLAWTPDGRHLLFGTSTFPRFPRPDTELELWRIPVEGGKPEKLGLAMPQMTQLRLHPDGKRIVFVAGERKADVWAMENFLPALTVSR